MILYFVLVVFKGFCTSVSRLYMYNICRLYVYYIYMDICNTYICICTCVGYICITYFLGFLTLPLPHPPTCSVFYLNSQATQPTYMFCVLSQPGYPTHLHVLCPISTSRVSGEPREGFLTASRGLPPLTLKTASASTNRADRSLDITSLNKYPMFSFCQCSPECFFIYLFHQIMEDAFTFFLYLLFAYVFVCVYIGAHVFVCMYVYVCSRMCVGNLGMYTCVSLYSRRETLW